MKKLDYKILAASCLAAGLLFASFEIHAATPSLSYKMDGKDLTITYVGTLYQSSDAVHWTEVGSASSPYKVKLTNKKLFFCAKGESGGSGKQDFTIPLSSTVSLDMVWCPAGTFTMGSPEGERGRCSNETQHTVTISRGFWIGKYEVTQGQYEALMGNNPSYWKATNHPVECVTWYEAMEFCQKLTQIEKSTGRLPVGYEYTLPTEAQWEYACRAGTTTALNSGKNLSGMYECPEMDEVGWYWYNGGEENYYNGSIWTHPVGQKKSNAWGLYDMHGNVCEWCKDWFGNYPSSSVVDPTGSSIGWIRVLRGGSWYFDASYCRSAKRGNCEPDGSYFSYGFRVTLAPVQ